MAATSSPTTSFAASSSSLSNNTPLNGKLPSYLDFLDFPVMLPTAWNPKDKYNLIELSKSNLQVHYKGAGKSDSDASAIRANHPIPSACGVYYFEVEVISKGRDGFMGIGLSWDSVSLNRLPGWEPNSYGYHADDGHSFAQSGTGKPFGPTFTTGDIVGCGVNFINNSVFFTKNGIYLGVAFRDVKGIFYPTVGLRTPGEVLYCNFGQRPFKYDINTHVRDERLKLKASILSGPSPVPSLNSLLLSYLVHHGYASTAQTFVTSLEGLSNGTSGGSDFAPNILQQLATIKDRQRIRDALMAGDIDTTIALTESIFPTVLPANTSLMFQLRCRKFIELVRQGAQESRDDDAWLAKTMAYGQQLQDEYANQVSGDDLIRLQETFSLLAYPDPFSSPVAHLLDPAGREAVATALNSAILVQQNSPAIPALELLVRQLMSVTDELIKQGVGAASLLNVRREWI